MAPIIVSTKRLVDPSVSPAFLSVRNAREELNGDGFHRSNLCIPNLNNAFEDFLDNGKASPFDTDRSGNTPFYVSKISTY